MGNHTTFADAHTEALLSAIVESSHDAIASKTLEGIVTSWNRAAERVFGYTREEMVGQDIRVLIPKERWHEEVTILQRLRQGERIESYETIRRRRDGRLIDVSLTISPVRNAEGQIVGASKIARDITERKRAEREIRDNQERLRVLTDAIPHFVWTSRPDGAIEFCNPRWLEYTGMALDSVQGDGWTAALHPDDYDKTLKAWRAAIAEEREYSMEQRLRRHDGEYRWFLTRAVPYRDAEGRAVQWYGTGTDIENQKTAEARLGMALERVQLVLGSITDSYFCIDRTYRLLEVNDAALRQIFCGHTRESLLGNIFWDLFPQSRGSAFHQHYELAFTEQSPVRFEARSKIVDSWFEVHLYPRDEHLEVYARDITERREAEEWLRAEARRKDDFLALLGHELRNPLAAVLNGLSLLELFQPRDEKEAQVLEMMQRQTGHILRMVDDLLDVSRITKGKITLRREPLRFSDLVRAVVREQFDGVAQDVGRHTLELDVSEEPIWVHGDTTRMTQVVTNLLQNAKKFTESGGTIRVRLTGDATKGRAVLSVQDTGIGIGPQTLERLFEPFSQGEHGKALVGAGGLGLGLSLVKGLVELHGGTVTAKSDGHGKGSEFIVELSLLEQVSSERGENLGEAPSNGKGGSVRVLVVEDSEAVGYLFAMLLKELGHEVRFAEDGTQALEVLQEYQPDIVFSDIRMPGMDGIELARRLRQDPRWRNLLLVATTGFGQPQDRERSLAAGFDYHLVKPAELESIQAILTQAKNRLKTEK
ncbi:MAG: PAS domain S-box protein [Bdellovibrionales bacterium]|nr:PAS domain S-box protein [Bdellovibrionales bacterium]